jgi:hypothetical protein
MQRTTRARRFSSVRVAELFLELFPELLDELELDFRFMANAGGEIMLI